MKKTTKKARQSKYHFSITAQADHGAQIADHLPDF
jgi:hypothetical protein